MWQAGAEMCQAYTLEINKQSWKNLKFITNLVAYFQGKRLLGNKEHHFRDLCKVRALSGSVGIWAVLIQNEESEKF